MSLNIVLNWTYTTNPIGMWNCHRYVTHKHTFNLECMKSFQIVCYGYLHAFWILNFEARFVIGHLMFGCGVDDEHQRFYFYVDDDNFCAARTMNQSAKSTSCCENDESIWKTAMTWTESVDMSWTTMTWTESGGMSWLKLWGILICLKFESSVETCHIWIKYKHYRKKVDNNHHHTFFSHKQSINAPNISETIEQLECRRRNLQFMIIRSGNNFHWQQWQRPKWILTTHALHLVASK